jgi:hypothetical protein
MSCGARAINCAGLLVDAITLAAAEDGQSTAQSPSRRQSAAVVGAGAGGGAVAGAGAGAGGAAGAGAGGWLGGGGGGRWAQAGGAMVDGGVMVSPRTARRAGLFATGQESAASDLDGELDLTAGIVVCWWYRE